MRGVSLAGVGLVIFGLTTPPAIFSAFLPSPSTAYDKAAGEISSGPESLKFLRRGEVIGGAVSVGVAIAASLVASEEMGSHAAWIFVGALVILTLFLYEYESAFRKGKAHAKESGEG